MAHDVISNFYRGCYSNANLVTVMISVAIPRSSPMVRERRGGQRRKMEDRGVVDVTGVEPAGVDKAQNTTGVDPGGPEGGLGRGRAGSSSGDGAPFPRYSSCRLLPARPSSSSSFRVYAYTD